MRLPATNVLITIGCSLVLFFVGINYYVWLSDALIPTVDGTILGVTKVTSRFEQSLPFACILAIVPILCMILWWRIPIKGTAKQAGSVLLIVAGMIAAVLIGRYFFETELKGLLRNTQAFRLNLQTAAAVDSFNIEYWMIIGILAGCVLTYLFFRKKQKNGHRSKKISRKI